MTETELVKQGMEPLFERARREGKLFRSYYQHIIFTPDELEAANKKGQYLWGAVNWELITPDSVIAELQHAVNYAQKELDLARMKYGTFKQVGSRKS